MREDRSLDADALRVEAERLVELGKLANGSVDLIGPGLVVVVVEEGEVDFDGRGRLDGQFLSSYVARID